MLYDVELLQIFSVYICLCGRRTLNYDIRSVLVLHFAETLQKSCIWQYLAFACVARKKNKLMFYLTNLMEKDVKF